MLLVTKSFLRNLNFSFLILCEEKTDPKQYIADLRRGTGHKYPDLQYHAVLEVSEEHPASNVNVVKLEERSLDVRRWDLHEKMKGWIDQILQRIHWPIHGHGPHFLSMWWP